MATETEAVESVSAELITSSFTPEQLVRLKDVEVQLGSARNGLLDSIFDLASLLSEIKSQEYYLVLNGGASSFAEWVDTHADLDMTSRQAYFLVQIIDKANKLGVTRPQLKAARLTKLKDIFSLDPDIHAEEIRKLIEEAPKCSYDVIRGKVAKVKAGGGDVEAFVYLQFKVAVSAKEVIDTAFERMRQEYGDTVTKDGEPTTISSSKCLEMICADYISGANS